MMDQLQLAAKEKLERMAVVAIAKTWLGTPYRSGAMKRGVSGGVDCANLPAAVYPEAGVIPKFEVEKYPPDWHLHRGTERYMSKVMEHAHELPEGELPKPGDMVVWKFGRCFSHGAIVVEWPRCVHAWIGVPCSFVDAEKDQRLVTVGEGGPNKGKLRERKFFTLWPQHGGKN